MAARVEQVLEARGAKQTVYLVDKQNRLWRMTPADAGAYVLASYGKPSDFDGRLLKRRPAALLGGTKREPRYRPKDPASAVVIYAAELDRHTARELARDLASGRAFRAAPTARPTDLAGVVRAAGGDPDDCVDAINDAAHQWARNILGVVDRNIGAKGRWRTEEEGESSSDHTSYAGGWDDHDSYTTYMTLEYPQVFAASSHFTIKPDRIRPLVDARFTSSAVLDAVFASEVARQEVADTVETALRVLREEWDWHVVSESAQDYIEREMDVALDDDAEDTVEITTPYTVDVRVDDRHIARTFARSGDRIDVTTRVDLGRVDLNSWTPFKVSWGRDAW